ncbi:Isotrichodermin C-15 hydroxylase 11 [Phlyctema vagabunda]|uniref:Isotrichodermin C-15 hydroxylase 11 n=1 Tax=Phlyctema vagabunda TaxID=108571 RepID=A0ABR4PCC4_9HELO
MLTHFVLVAILLTVLYRGAWIIYNLYFHPLAKFPGPKIHAASRLAWNYAILRGDMVRSLRDLHAKYGPVVRMTNNDLSIITPTAWREIYSHTSNRTFMKDEKAYGVPLNSEARSLLTAFEEDHARCRRLMSHAFSDRALRDQQGLLKSYVDSLVKNLEDRAKGGPKEATTVDISQWYNFTTFDVIGDLAFGSSFDCLKEEALHPWAFLIFASIKAIVVFSVAEKYWPINKILLFISKRAGGAEKQAYHVQLTKEKLKQRLAIKTDRPDFITYILRHNDEKGMSIQELEANASLLIKAGSETTATGLSGATYLLLKNPDKLEILVKEIRSTFTSVDQMDATNLSNCKYLDACLKESLRMYPPVPVGLPRKATEDTVVSGWRIPKGTTVQIPSWSSNYWPENFNNPKTFAPERWLAKDPSSPYFNDHLESCEPFSLGPKNCIGKNLAWLELRLILARVLYAFDLELLDSDWDPEQQKVYLLWQKPPLNVRLTPRNYGTEDLAN